MQKDHSFPGKHAHGPPTLLCTKKQFYPFLFGNQNAKFARPHMNKPIKNNMVVLTWYTI